MKIFGELSRYLAVIASLPILLIVDNRIVASSLLKTIMTISFVIWFVIMVTYIVIRRNGYLSRIKSIPLQVVVETSLVTAPLAYPLYMVFTENGSYEYEGIFLAYLTFGIILMIYQLGRRGGVGSVGKICSFLLAYIFSLMVYAGSLASTQINTPFHLIVAFHQLFRVGAVIGYPTYLVIPPMEAFVKISMALATPAIIFLALSAEIDKAEAKGRAGKSGIKLSSSLRFAITLLTFAGAAALSIALLLSLWLGESRINSVTLVPPLSMAIILMAVVFIFEGRKDASIR